MELKFIIILLIIFFLIKSSSKSTENFAMITPRNAEECRAAATQANLTYAGDVNSSMYPRKCYKWPGDNKVRWNAGGSYQCGKVKTPVTIDQCKGAAIAAGKSYHGNVSDGGYKPNCFLWSDGKVRYNTSRSQCSNFITKNIQADTAANRARCTYLGGKGKANKGASKNYGYVGIMNGTYPPKGCWKYTDGNWRFNIGAGTGKYCNPKYCTASIPTETVSNNKCRNSRQLNIPSAQCIKYDTSIEAQKILNGEKTDATIDDVLEAGKTLNKKECDLCLGIMTALEPSIIIAYKVFVQSASPGAIVGSLLFNVFGGAGKAGLTKNTVGVDSENNIRNSFAYAPIKGWLDDNPGFRQALGNLVSTTDTDIITVRLIQAIIAAVSCLGANFTFDNIAAKLGEVKNLKAGIIHGFLRCMIIEITRFSVMALTKCGQIHKCTPGVNLYQELEKGTGKWVAAIGKGAKLALQERRERQHKGQQASDDAVVSVGEQIVGSAIKWFGR